MKRLRNIRVMGPNHNQIFVYRRDFSLGKNSRVDKRLLQDNECYINDNFCLDTIGALRKRPGCQLIGNDVGNNPCRLLLSYNIQNSTNRLILAEGTNLWKWATSGNWSNISSTRTATIYCGGVACKQSGLSPDDMFIFQNGTDNAIIVDSNDTVTDLLDDTYSIPKTNIMAWYNNRVWALKNDLLYFSTVYPATYVPQAAVITGNFNTFTGILDDKIKVTIDDTAYDNINIGTATTIAEVVSAINTAVGSEVASTSGDGYLVITSPTLGLAGNVKIEDGTTTAQPVVGDLVSETTDREDIGYAPFDRVSNAFRLPVGEERGLIVSRDMGLIAFGKNAIWGLAASYVPTATTDQPYPIDERRGCVAKQTVIAVGDDIYYLSDDGLRSLKRTIYDKVQAATSFPLSYQLREDWERVNWSYADRACACYWDNKVFLALPVNSSTYNNEVWVYYPANQAWSVIKGWNVASFATLKVGSEERLYYADANDGKVYRAWYGYTDNGTAISTEFQSRDEDLNEIFGTKNGGVVEILGRGIGGSFTLPVYFSKDDGTYGTLGTMTLNANTETRLPVDLPFSLGSSMIVSNKFHIDSFEGWRRGELKIINSDATTGDFEILEYNIRTYREEPKDE